MWIAGLEAPPYYLLSVDPATHAFVVLQFVAELLRVDWTNVQLFHDHVPLVPSSIMETQVFEPVQEMRVDLRSEQHPFFLPLHRVPPIPDFIGPLRHVSVDAVSWADPDGREFLWGMFWRHHRGVRRELERRPV